MRHLLRPYVLLALFGLLLCCAHKPSHQQSETWRTCSAACVETGGSAHMVVEDETKVACVCKKLVPAEPAVPPAGT